MKRKITFLALFGAALSSGVANEIPVRLQPSVESPEIGELEAPSLAVPAEWPKDASPSEDWQPVYFRGAFEVFVDNNAIAKDLSVKPGSKYYLAPNRDAPILSIATAQDSVDILGVDTQFCKMQLETIVVGYIQSGSSTASQAIPSSPQPGRAVSDNAGQAITELVGRLEKAGLVGRNRTGMDHKLIGPEGKTLAFVDLSELPERIHLDDYIGIEARVSGFLLQTETGKDVILEAKSIKKAQ